MMRPLRFIRLSPPEQAALVEAACHLAWFRYRLFAQPLERVVISSSPAPRRPGRAARSSLSVERLAWAVRVAARLLPGTRCLPRALALQRMLWRRGIQGAELHIGVARDANGAFNAHAWMELEGRAIMGEGNLQGFRSLPLNNLLQRG